MGFTRYSLLLLAVAKLNSVVGCQEALPDLELDVNEKDDDGCSPLFVSLLHGAPISAV